MNTLQDMLTSLQKQNKSMQNVFGMSSLLGIADSIRRQTQSNYNLTVLSGITDIAKTISQQMRPFNASKAILANSLQPQLLVQQFSKNRFALFGLTSSLSEIAKNNQLVSDRLSGFASSQLFLSNSLTGIAKAINQSHLNKFNSLDIAIQGVSQTYLKDIVRTHNWEDIEIAEQANHTITAVTDELINNATQITVEDIDQLKQSIIYELSTLLTKTRTQKARQFIFNLIAIIGLLLTFYGDFMQVTDNSNQDVINITKNEFERFNKELSDKIAFELIKFNKTRIAVTNVNLRYSTKKNTKIIGLLKIGQQVTVIENRHKYMLVTYIDKETGMPKSGFVVKKYFERE
ncbi:MAG: hypothetical protein WCI71_12595 [Bacteroidota bacterium]